jgi:SNF2 family DNA or RNA helicase
MGSGKTFEGSEKMIQLGAKVNLVVCQKSKIDDWCEHFKKNYKDDHICAFDLTDSKSFKEFFRPMYTWYDKKVGVINYDLLWRRKELLKLKDFTLLLDESSLIQNETAKRSKFILKMNPKNVILLSGTPTGGKYEKLWSQMHLLGWNISKQLYWKQYVITEYLDTMDGRSIPIVTGYKNVDRLKRKMNEYGCQFLKTDEVFDLPSQTFTKVRIPASKEYRIFRKDRIVTVGETELVGDTTLTRMLYERMLCGIYSEAKLKAFTDLVESTEDRLIVFYNFTEELNRMETLLMNENRPISIVNGSYKNLDAYEKHNDSITFIQYQSGAMGLNLQKANKIIYFTLPLSSELYEQSKKRIHRIGQNQPCFYYQLIVTGSIEEKILKTLEMRKDFTEKLFEKDD